MVGWHHRLNGYEFEEILGDSERQGSLVCYSPRGHKELDMTQQLNNKCHSYSLVIMQLTSSPRWCFSLYKTAPRIWLRLPIACEKELKVLDFAYGLNYYYFVQFNCFSLLLHFLTSLIEFILWLSFPIDKRQTEDMEGRIQGPALFQSHSSKLFCGP